MNTRILIAALCLCACIAAPSLLAAQTIPADNIVLLPAPNDPTISFRLWFKVGAQNDPQGKEGLANLTAAMLSDGATLNNSYDQILDKLFPLAAGYDVSSSMEMTIASGRTHKDNLNDYYPLFMDAILRPAFAEKDFDRVKGEIVDYLENTLRYSSDEELGKAVLYTSIFEGTPYGHIPSGTIGSVKGITLDDVRNFYKKYYTRENIVIGLGGSYDNALVEKLKNDLASLPAGKPETPPKPEPKKIDGMNFTIVDKADAPATAISMGFPITLTRGHKDWYALAIANSWLGEHRSSSSHLYAVIRTARGLNYGDYSYIENFPGGGFAMIPPQNVSRRQQIFEIWIRPVPNEARHFALRAALNELQKLIDNGLTQEQFELKRNFLKKFVANYAQTTSARLGYALDDKFYGINGSHLENYGKYLSEITLQDVNAAMKKYWQYKDMKIGIITQDAAGFKKALVEDTPSPITYKSEKPKSVMDEDLIIQKYPIKVKAENVTIVPLTDLFVK